MTIELLHWVVSIVLAIAVIKLCIDAEAAKRSTHQMTYVDPFKDMKSEFEKISEKTEKELTKDIFGNIV